MEKTYPIPFPHFKTSEIVISSATCLSSLEQPNNSQNTKAAKTPRSARMTPVLKQLGWPKIEDAVRHKDAMLVHHAINSSLAPPLLTSLFKPRAEVSQRETRTKHNALELPPFKLGLARRSLEYRAAVVWNALPTQVTDTVGRKAFKSKLPF